MCGSLIHTVCYKSWKSVYSPCSQTNDKPLRCPKILKRQNPRPPYCHLTLARLLSVQTHIPNLVPTQAAKKITKRPWALYNRGTAPVKAYRLPSHRGMLRTSWLYHSICKLAAANKQKPPIQAQHRITLSRPHLLAQAKITDLSKPTLPLERNPRNQPSVGCLKVSDRRIGMIAFDWLIDLYFDIKVPRKCSCIHVAFVFL